MPQLNFTGAEAGGRPPPEPEHPRDEEPEPLGVLGGDNQGWPNGRRLGDDVIDIAEQAVAGFLKGKKVPLGDGVDADDRARSSKAFPYVARPARAAS